MRCYRGWLIILGIIFQFLMSSSQSETPLAQRNSVHRGSDEDKLSPAQIQRYLSMLNAWSLANDGDQDVLTKEIKVKDFAAAVELAFQIGALADEQDHHPTLIVGWGRLTVRWWTHSVQALTENDFILAAKVDQLLDH